MFDYQKPDRGWGGDPRRGAAMGRSSTLDATAGVKLHLRKVRLYGDYDQGGTYWGGGGTPLWCAWDDNTGDVRYLRASDRNAAKAQFKGARFFR